VARRPIVERVARVAVRLAAIVAVRNRETRLGWVGIEGVGVELAGIERAGIEGAGIELAEIELAGIELAGIEGAGIEGATIELNAPTRGKDQEDWAGFWQRIGSQAAPGK
jgi:hypothetical protein